MMNTHYNAAVLVGNGLSIAFNSELNLQSITQEVLRRIEEAEGGDVVAAMQELAERAIPEGVNSADDFELLVGAFGAEASALGIFNTLAELTKPADHELVRSIGRVVEFAGQVRDTGISYVLEVIADRSHAYMDEAQDLHQMINAISDAFAGRITFGNLNYDTLLLAALLAVCKGELADMGHGWKSVTVSVENAQSLSVPALRRHPSDFPEGRRVRLLHLHGSLTYWAREDAELYGKLPRELVEDGGQWKAVREQTTNVRPVVVLANRRDKTEHVDRYPFKLAYEVFSQGLSESAHWIVIGYSFRDDPVNAMLRREFIGRSQKPRVLVVTHGSDPTRETVERAFGWGAEDGASDAWLLIDREGADGCQETDEWAAFIPG